MNETLERVFLDRFFFFFLQWICSSGSIEWTPTVVELALKWCYLKQTTLLSVNRKSLCYSERPDSSTASSGICLLFDACRVELYI